jgi:hypothetical protein
MGDLHKKTTGKLNWNLMPFEELEEVMKAIQFGADTYQPDGWKQSQDPFEFFAAIMRHITAWNIAVGNQFALEDLDSRLNHMAHVAANALFLLYFDKRRRIDDEKMSKDKMLKMLRGDKGQN